MHRVLQCFSLIYFLLCFVFNSVIYYYSLISACDLNLFPVFFRKYVYISIPLLIACVFPMCYRVQRYNAIKQATHTHHIDNNKSVLCSIYFPFKNVVVVYLNLFHFFFAFNFLIAHLINIVSHSHSHLFHFSI